MRDLPDISELIALIERDDAAPQAARCRAIAQREARTGWAPYAALATEIAALLGDAAGAAPLARLAGQIRHGGFDAPGPARARLEALLRRLVRQRLLENNPDFLL